MAASSSSSNGEQQYSLRWNDFHSSILSSFRHLRDEEDFVDVTLACDSSSFTAHKVVLSACSPYFRKLLKANPCQHPIVILRDVASSDMESLLRFMYHGEVHVGQEQLAAFLKTAQMLQVRGLADVKSSPAGSKLPASQSRLRDNGGSPITSRNTWHDRGDPSDSGLSPPPEKRSKSYSPPAGNHLELKGDLQDSLLGQALEGGPTIHTTPNNNIQAQSVGDDSNSVSDNDEDMSNNDSILNSVKAEPNDSILNDSLEHHRNSFPAALLGLQGLMPGPSGIHAANQDPNYDDEHDRLEDAAAAASISYHHHNQIVIKVEDDDGENSALATSTTKTTVVPSGMTTRIASSTNSANEFHRDDNIFSSLGDLLREHHREYGYDCPLCSKMFLDIIEIRAHLDRHYPKDSPRCPVYSCQKIFAHPNSVRNHMRLKHSVQWEKIKALRWTYV